MRESSCKKLLWISFKSSSVFPSNLITNFGVVLDALISPQPFLKFILNPSIFILSPFKLQFLEKSSIILNFVSSVTVIFNSGVENKFGKSLLIAEMLLLLFDINSLMFFYSKGNKYAKGIVYFGIAFEAKKQVL